MHHLRDKLDAMTSGLDAFLAREILRPIKRDEPAEQLSVIDGIHFRVRQQRQPLRDDPTSQVQRDRHMIPLLAIPLALAGALGAYQFFFDVDSQLVADLVSGPSIECATRASVEAIAGACNPG